MTIFQILEFTFKLSIAAPETATWIYILLTLLFFIFAIGWGWGKMWNREWSLGGHVGALFMILAFGLLAAYSVFNLRGISRMEDWFQQQRMTLARSVADSGRFNRSVLKSTWDQVAPKSSQEGLTPPTEGGTEVRLNTPEDAFVLASTAADETRSTLRNKLPFSLGVPISTRNPSDIATEAVDAIRFDSKRFPTIAAENNEWSKTAATIQANHALDTAHATIKPGLQDLKTASFWLLIASFLVPAFAIPMSALADIKINPTPKR